MRNIRLSILISAILFTCMLSAQNSSAGDWGFHMGLKVNPLGLFIGSFSGAAEVQVKDYSSVQLGFQYWGGFLPVSPSSDRIGGITAGYRCYLEKSFGEGWFMEPFARVNMIRNVNSSGKVISYTGGVTLGKQWLNDYWSYEFFCGPYYAFPTAVGFDPDANDNSLQDVIKKHNPYNGVWFRTGVTVGVSF